MVRYSDNIYEGAHVRYNINILKFTRYSDNEASRRCHISRRLYYIKIPVSFLKQLQENHGKIKSLKIVACF